MSQLNISTEITKVMRFAKVAMKDIYRNKVRSFLSLIGIVIGVSSVIVIIGLNQSATVVIKQKIYTYGKNALRVHTRNTPWISRRDISELKSSISNIKYFTTMIDQYGSIGYKSQNLKDVIVHGVENDYFLLKNWKVEKGRVFNQNEIDSAARVVVIGKYIEQVFFPGENNAIGKKISHEGQIFTIIGVLKPKGSGLAGTNYDKIMMIPSTTCARLFYNNDGFEQIYISVEDELYEPNMVKIVEQYFRKRNHLLPGQKNNFDIDTTREKTVIIKYISTALKYLMVIVATISLIVGGIGIMNIMLAVVNERIREIGIRMAIGAQKRDIMTQFILESLLLCVTGGIIGIIIGIAGYVLAVSIAGWPFVFSYISLLIAFIFSVGIGLFFGFFPAFKASKLHPIEALKNE